MNVSLSAASRRISRLVPALACLAMLGTGCGQQKAPSRQEADRRVLAADSLHMARLYARWQQEVQAQGKGGRKNDDGRQMPIDLSDDAQYSFVKNRLLAAGNTPENSPQLFRRLEKARKEKKTGTPPGAAAREALLTSQTSGESSEGSRCGHLLPLTDVVTSDTSVARFQASGLVTCFNGSDYSYADVTAFAANPERTRFRVLDTQSLEEYAGAVLETPPVDLGLAVGTGEELFVDSMAMAFDESTGESHLSYAAAESSIVALTARDYNILRIEHPRELVGNHFQDNPIRTCLERGYLQGYLDCDYATGSKDPVTGVFTPFAKPYTGISAVDPSASKPPMGEWVPARGHYWEPAGGYDVSHLYVAMSGEYLVSLPEHCNVDTLTSDASVILMERGGKCSAGTAPGTSVLKGSIPFKTPFADTSLPALLHVPFSGVADFGRDCLRQFQNARLMLRATMRATCTDSRGNQTSYTRSRFQDIVNVDWRNACLAEGTRVTKADGKTVPVEQVKLGDKLLANGRGVALTVTAVSRGGEHKPLVKLRDEQGGEVMVTETHPMVTAKRGVVQAAELKVGEALLTRTGTATLVGVERVPFSGQVFNFALGTPEELASVGPEARTLYANGYLVGDSHMQATLEKRRTLDTRELLTRLDGAWHEDFRLHQARHARK
ncbi:hypothetical protein JQX13_09560 [Archangium violaceum]|uniref:Hint domain-containing protein n=1 Tax=Archangium violaceum TaxID=83451 RepID=UPI00193B2769|nr:Hint domain-containing protein [Archangium violaceum]QRK10309.1 hypothetical protein JQX13_09560 [Archangium violaceum]